jgi:hypothetical protein
MLKRKSPLKSKTTLKRKSAKPIPKLRHEADRWFSLATRYRDSEFVRGEWIGPCITCERPTPLKMAHAGHFMSRRFAATRWEEENVNLQCAGCNMFGAGEQYKYSLALDMKYGDGTAAKLAKQSKETFKVTREFLEGVIKDAKTEVDFYTKQ